MIYRIIKSSRLEKASENIRPAEFLLEIRPGQAPPGAGGGLGCAHHCGKHTRALQGEEVHRKSIN